MKFILVVLGFLAALWIVAMVVGIAGRLVLAATKPGWSTFVDTWEDVHGYSSLKHPRQGPSRSGAETSDAEVAAMEALYREWRAEGRPPLAEWLRQRG